MPGDKSGTAPAPRRAWPTSTPTSCRLVPSRRMRSGDEPDGIRLEGSGDERTVVHRPGYRYPLRAFHDAEAP